MNLFCKKDNKKCYDKKTARTVKNDRWKKDRIDLRMYHCKAGGLDHWHLTKKVREPKWEKKKKFWR